MKSKKQEEARADLEALEPSKSRISICSGYACRKSCICSRFIMHCKAKEKGEKIDDLPYVDAVVCVRHNFVNFIEVQI